MSRYNYPEDASDAGLLLAALRRIYAERGEDYDEVERKRMTDYDTRRGIARKFTSLADAIVAQAEPERPQTSAPIDFPVCRCGHKHFNRPGQAESGFHKACPICKCKKERI